MKRQRPANDTLDELGTELIRHSRPNADDIDGVVSNPQLFEQITSRMRTLERPEWRARTWIMGSLPLIYSYRKLIAGTAAAAFIFAAAVTVLRSLGPEPQEYAVQSSNNVDPGARPVNPPEISYELSPGRASLNETRIAPKATKRAIPAVYHKQQTPRPAENSEEFYPLFVADGSYEPLNGGRIVRVNIDRSSLLALGVNLPLENDGSAVTADLLVGPDGVTRAFRVVR